MRKSQHEFEQRFHDLSTLKIKSHSGFFNFTERNEILAALKNDAHELVTNIDDILEKPNVKEWKKNPKKQQERNGTQAQMFDCNALKQRENDLTRWMAEFKNISNKAKNFIGTMKKRIGNTTKSKSKNTTGTATNRKQ